MSWNSDPPRGAPMVAVPWTGPYYPPDAADHGKTPSDPSDVFVALKRTLGRLGAWPWDPDGYDNVYSNSFAHGSDKGPGIAAVQRWAKIEPDTGWIGKTTWNFLRSVLVPAGRPHAGEHAMDDYSAALIVDAAELEPELPDPPPRELAMEHLAAREGYTEDPPESNCDSRPDGIRTAQDLTAGGTWLRGEPWCGCWCFYALDAAGVTGLGSWMASVASIEDRAKQHLSPFEGWTTDSSRVRVGDLAVVGGRGVHVETVRGFSGSTILTWGGNTSPGSSGSQSNGGGAFARSRSPGEVYGFALVRYPGE